MEASSASNLEKSEDIDLDSRLEDPNIEEKIVNQLKAQGVFDKFRKDCLADVDTKPAYQNLRSRVDTQVYKFLEKNVWHPSLNKNALRNQLRSHIQGMDIEAGLDRIVEQIVNPKLTNTLMPEVENAILQMYGTDHFKQESEEVVNGMENKIIENGCDQVENGEVPPGQGALSSEDVDMEAQGGSDQDLLGYQLANLVPMSLLPGMVPPPPPPVPLDPQSASSNGEESSPGLAGQISPLTPGRESATSISPPPAPVSPSVAAGDISPLTPTRGGDISPLTPPLPPEENSHDIPAVGAEGEVAMEVDSHTPPGSPPRHSYTPSFTPPLPKNSFIPPRPVPFQRPLTPHTPPLPPLPPSTLDLESGGEASMSSISDGDMPDVSPPRHSPSSPSSSNDEDPTSRSSLDRLHPTRADAQQRSGPSDISDTELPSVGSDRPESGASMDRAASKESGEAVSDDRVASAASVAASPGGEASSAEDENLENLEQMKSRIMAQLNEDFHLSPESDSEGEIHSSDDDDDKENDEENKPVTEETNQPPADMSPVSEGSMSVTPVPAAADPASRPVSTEPLSSSSSLPDSPRGPFCNAPRTDTPSSPNPETCPPHSRPQVSPSQPQASNISPNQLLRMRTLPLPSSKSLNTAQVLKTLPFPEGEGRPPPPEPEGPRRGPQTSSPLPGPWDLPRGPRTPEPQFSPDQPEQKSRTPSPDCEPLYYEKQTRGPTTPPSPPTAFSRDPSPPSPPSAFGRGHRTPPLGWNPPGAPRQSMSPPQSSFSRLDLSEETINAEQQQQVQSGCKPFAPPRRDSRDSDGGDGGGGKFGGASGAAPCGGEPVAASSTTESKLPVYGSNNEIDSSSKTHLPISSKDKAEKKKELITKQQKAKIEKYDQKIKTTEKIKSDKFLDLDIFSTVKTPKMPHVPHRNPTDSGSNQKSPSASSTKTSTSSRSSSSSKILEHDQKEKDKKGKLDETFLKPGKIPDRRSSSDVKKDSDSKTNSKDHEARSSKDKYKERRSSSDKERGRDKESRNKDRARDSKEREKEKNKEKDRGRSEKYKEKSEEDVKKVEKSRKKVGEDDLKKMDKLDRDRGRDEKHKERDRGKHEKYREKSEEGVKKGGKSTKDSGEDDKKKVCKSDQYNSNFDDVKQKLGALRERKEKEERERKEKEEREKKQKREKEEREKKQKKEKEEREKKQRKENEEREKKQKKKEKKKLIESEKKGRLYNEISEKINNLSVEEINQVLADALIKKGISKKAMYSQLQLLEGKKKNEEAESVAKEKNNQKKSVISDNESSQDEDVLGWKENLGGNRTKSGESTNTSENVEPSTHTSENIDPESPLGEKMVKENSNSSAGETNSKKKAVISDEELSGDSNSRGSPNSENESPNSTTRSQIIRSMKERPVQVNVDKSLTKTIDFSWWYRKEKNDSSKVETEKLETGNFKLEQEESHGKEHTEEKTPVQETNGEIILVNKEEGVPNNVNVREEDVKSQMKKVKNTKLSSTPESVKRVEEVSHANGLSEEVKEPSNVILKETKDEAVLMEREEKEMLNKYIEDKAAKKDPKEKVNMVEDVSHVKELVEEIKGGGKLISVDYSDEKDCGNSNVSNEPKKDNNVKTKTPEQSLPLDRKSSPIPLTKEAILKKPDSELLEETNELVLEEAKERNKVTNNENQVKATKKWPKKGKIIKTPEKNLPDDDNVKTKTPEQSLPLDRKSSSIPLTKEAILKKPDSELLEEKKPNELVLEEAKERNKVANNENQVKATKKRPKKGKIIKTPEKNLPDDCDASHPPITQNGIDSMVTIRESYVSLLKDEDQLSVSSCETDFDCDSSLRSLVSHVTSLSMDISDLQFLTEDEFIKEKQEKLQSPGAEEKKAKKRSNGGKWDIISEWVPDKPVLKTNVEKQLSISTGSVDWGVSTASGVAKRARKANVKYSDEFTAYTDSEEDVPKSLSKTNKANNVITPTNGQKKRTSSETISTPKKDSVITPKEDFYSISDISPGGKKRNSSKNIIAEYIKSASLERTLEQDKKAFVSQRCDEVESISSPSRSVVSAEVNDKSPEKVTQKSAKENPKVHAVRPEEEILSSSNDDSVGMVDKFEVKDSSSSSSEKDSCVVTEVDNSVGMLEQLKRDIITTDRNINETMLLLLAKKKKREEKEKVKEAFEECPPVWNSILKQAIKKIKSMKQGCNVDRLANWIRRNESALKEVTDITVEKKLEEAAIKGVVERMEKLGKVTYRIPSRGALLKLASDLESSRVSSEDLEYSKTSSEDLVSSRFSSVDEKLYYHRTVENWNDSSDEMEDMYGFSPEEIGVQIGIFAFLDTSDRLDPSGAKFSNLDELEGVSLNDSLLKCDDEEALTSPNLNIIMSDDIQMYIKSLKATERQNLEEVKGHGTSAGVGSESVYISDESDSKGSSSPESFGSSKENQPNVSSVIGKAKRNNTPTRKRKSNLKGGLSLKKRKVS